MVQIIPRPKSFGEKIGAGIGHASEALAPYTKMHFEHEMEQKSKQAERAQKLAGLEELKKTPYWKNASDLEKAVLEREITGDISAQTAKSLINLKREQDVYGRLAGLQDIDEFSPSAATESIPGAIPGEEFAPPESFKRGKPSVDHNKTISNLDAQIKKLEPYLTDPSKEIRDITQKKIDNLNKKKEFELKTSKFEFQQEQAGKAETEAAYKAQKPFIDDITNAYKGFVVDMKPRLMQMQTMDPESLISPTAAVFLDALGIPLGALEDPHSELYQKVSQDLLKGLPETYGNRILKVEVDNFLKTIPTLMNSPEGRRMIASNMLKLGEMKEVYYNAMRQMQQDYLDNDRPMPKDFEQRVFDQVLPQINRINNEFVKLSEITAVPPGTVPFFTPSGDIKFVPKHLEQWAIENQGRRIW
jgi:hypothetical protein